MEIKEIPCGPKKEVIKKVSPKVQDYAHDYIAQYGLQIDQLTGEQQNYVLRYSRWKIDSRWVVPFLLCMASVVGLVTIFFYLRIKKLDPLIEPEEEIVIVNSDGNKSVRKVPPEVREYVKNYSSVCSFLAAVTTGAALGSISGFFGAIGMLRTLRDQRKILDAFLPAVYQAVNTSV